jgi:hypothetical protein
MHRLWVSLALLACLATPASAAERTQRGVIDATRAVVKAYRAVRQLRREHADAATLERAQARLTATQATFCKRLQASAPVQLLRGAFVEGPKHLWGEVKAHPLRTTAILAGAVGLCTAAGMVGIPIDTIALGTSAALTVKAIAGNWRQVRAAFRRHSRTRWETVGEEVVFPAAAFAAGVGLGAVAEGATHAAHANGALGVGLRSTAQSVDDLVPLATALGPRDQHAPKKPPR